MKKKETMIHNIIGKIDWLQIICHNIFWVDVFEKLLGIGRFCVTEQSSSLKHEEYDVMYVCGSIRYYTSRERIAGYTRGTLILSGQACSMYEWVMLASEPESFVFQELAWRINRQAIETSFTYEVKRLDLALDDYNEKPFFTVDQLIGKAKRKQFVSKGRVTKVIDSEFDKNNRAKTLQIGSGGSSCLFRIYEKNKEMARSFSDVRREEILEKAPQVRFEAELRNDVAISLFQAIGSLAKEIDLDNLIRGFIKTELNFYSDSSYQTICRWWQAYLTPSQEPRIHRQYHITDFEDTLVWYEQQGGQAISQALYFLVSKGMEIPSQIFVGKKDCYLWTPEMSAKMIDYVSRYERTDLIPLIQMRTKERF